MQRPVTSISLPLTCCSGEVLSATDEPPIPVLPWRPLALLRRDSSMIMAASWDGSALMEASAMAEVMVLMLSMSSALVLAGETKLWSTDPGAEWGSPGSEAGEDAA